MIITARKRLDSLPRSRFLDVTQRSPKRTAPLLGERCVTSKKRLRGRLVPRQSTSNSAQSTDQKPCVIIAGDSMLKYINGRKLSSQISNQSLTYVKAFPGATVEDMSDYIMPSLRRKPEEVILHVGTNNLKFSEPREIAEGIVNLGLKIQNHSPDCKITISSLISRSDQTLNGKIKDVSKIVNQFAKQHAWRTIPHSNIKNEHLNASGLHLNVQGTKLLAKNLISHLRNS